MAEYALYAHESLKPKIPYGLNFYNAEPPLASIREAYQHYFSVDVGDRSEQWMRIILPVYIAHIESYEVAKKKLVVNIHTDMPISKSLSLSVICRKDGNPDFRERAPVNERQLVFEVGFKPASIQLVLFYEKLKIDFVESVPLRQATSMTVPWQGKNMLGRTESFGAFWDLLHPKIVKVSRSRFESEHHADSVEAALKEVNNVVKILVKKETGEEFDGADLMNRAFSLKKPIIELDDLSTETGRNIQQGYMQIFSGAMTGIRNPKAHGNIRIDETRAIHLLFLASLLMCKIDERRKIKVKKSI